MQMSQRSALISGVPARYNLDWDERYA